MITLKGLDFARFRNWIMKAAHSRKEDPVASFIFVWISFNHYYSTFAFENNTDFKNWSRQNFDGKKGDKAELLYLVCSKDFAGTFADFRSLCPERLSLTIDLPIVDMLWGSRVPERVNGTQRLSDLSTEDLFRVIYQIRNNLFHGSKDPLKSQRDHIFCVTASEFMVPLAAFLATNTYGEVMYGYDDLGKELREEVKGLIKA